MLWPSVNVEPGENRLNQITEILADGNSLLLHGLVDEHPALVELVDQTNSLVPSTKAPAESTQADLRNKKSRHISLEI